MCVCACVCPGGEITSTFDHPELVKLGHCKLIEEVMIGEDTLIHFSGVALGTLVIEQSLHAVSAARVSALSRV